MIATYDSKKMGIIIIQTQALHYEALDIHALILPLLAHFTEKEIGSKRLKHFSRSHSLQFQMQDSDPLFFFFSFHFFLYAVLSQAIQYRTIQ